jgi:hypothetical protein
MSVIVLLFQANFPCAIIDLKTKEVTRREKAKGRALRVSFGSRLERCRAEQPQATRPLLAFLALPLPSPSMAPLLLQSRWRCTAALLLLALSALLLSALTPAAAQPAQDSVVRGHSSSRENESIRQTDAERNGGAEYRQSSPHVSPRPARWLCPLPSGWSKSSRSGLSLLSNDTGSGTAG